jgi:cell division protein FtsA
MLNGGIIITGGGSQLKHLIQLTEYTTGLNARIGLPNEHLAANHIDELKKPMYATCIGLILKGYNDYEHNKKDFDDSFARVTDVPKGLVKEENAAPQKEQFAEELTSVNVDKRKKGLNSFWDKFKDSIIDLFKEEGDREMK